MAQPSDELAKQLSDADSNLLADHLEAIRTVSTAPKR